MIVVCSTCQARFKVADDKIGPRGAKVRCSKCQTVFVVHKDLGVVPAEPPPPAEPALPSAPPPAGGLDLDLEGAPGAGVRPNGFAGNPFARGAPPDPFASSPAPPPVHDPFGAADPFAEPAAPPPPQPDPFTAQDPFSGGGFGAVDPFVATVASPAPGLPTSAVTDLSDLLAGAQPPEPAPPPEPRPESSGILDTGFDFDPSAGAAPELGAASSPPAPSFDAGAGAGADLALDERTPAHGIAAAPVPGYGDFDPFEEPPGAPAQPQASGGSTGFAAADFDAFGDDSAPVAEPPPQRAPPTREPSPPEVAPPAEPAPPVETTGEVVAAAGFRSGSRARAVAVNAISLVALLAVVIGMLALWRGVRPGSGGFFRPAEVFGAIGERPPPFATAQVRSGIYDRADGPPLLFVTGKAISRSPAPVPGLRVSVEVVRRGAVVARGEARAGQVPTPEELNGFKDAASFGAALAQKAEPPASVKPGDAIPFLVAIADFPPDVAGSALRVTVEPAEEAPPTPAPPAPAQAAPPLPAPEGAAKP